MLRVGSLLYGYCNGHFGRDSYSVKRVEAIGADWIVARSEAGEVCFANIDPDTLVEFSTQEARKKWEGIDG